jgi:hypothetical protein
MLTINLLTERRDAERYYRRWKLGDVCVDWLVMHLDRTVRRRLHQEFRILKKYNERVRNRVVKDEPSYVPTMVRREIQAHDGYGNFKSLDVIRIEPARLRVRARVQRGVGACPKGKELGVGTPVPEPTPVGFERNAVHGKHPLGWVRGNPKAHKRVKTATT